MHRGPVAEIDLSAVSHNLDILRGIVNNRTIIAMVKADAYGHGSVEISKRLLSNGVTHLAVAYTGEAKILRDAGINASIIVLFDTENISDYFSLNLIPVVRDMKIAEAFSEEAKVRGRSIPVHMKIDTGMGRLGFMPEMAVESALEIIDMKGILLKGIFSHFSEADLADRSFADYQLSVFNDITEQIKKKTGLNLICHIANSAAILSFPDALLDAVRPGLALYGSSPLDTEYGLRPVMKIKTKLLSIRNMPSGHPVSYGRTFITKRESRIGVVPIGYADGYNRLFSNNAEMLVRGIKAPVVGRVCMDLTMIDVTEIEDVSEGDEVVVIGQQGNEKIDAKNIASRINTIPYEIMTSLGSRARREYINCLA